MAGRAAAPAGGARGGRARCALLDGLGVPWVAPDPHARLAALDAAADAARPRRTSPLGRCASARSSAAARWSGRPCPDGPARLAAGDGPRAAAGAQRLRSAAAPVRGRRDPAGRRRRRRPSGALAAGAEAVARVVGAATATAGPTSRRRPGGCGRRRPGRRSAARWRRCGRPCSTARSATRESQLHTRATRRPGARVSAEVIVDRDRRPAPAPGSRPARAASAPGRFAALNLGLGPGRPGRQRPREPPPGLRRARRRRRRGQRQPRRCTAPASAVSTRRAARGRFTGPCAAGRRPTAWRPGHRRRRSRCSAPTACRCSSGAAIAPLVAAAHAGWRGLVAGVLEAAVARARGPGGGRRRHRPGDRARAATRCPRRCGTGSRAGSARR